MLLYYFGVAWRNISRRKLYTSINVIGLSIGISACIAIFLITQFELGFDKFHPDADRIYRIVGEVQRSSGEVMFANSPIPEVAAFENVIPGFEAKTAFFTYGARIKVRDGKGQEKEFVNRIANTWTSNAVLTDPGFFEVFKHDWLAGDASVLKMPYRVVLSEDRAKLYFGNLPVSKMIGKSVIYDDSLQVTVAGVVKEWNKNSDFKFTDFISISTGPRSFLKGWIGTDDWSSLQPHHSMAFVKLSKGTTAAQVNARFADYINRHVKIPGWMTKLTMYLQPLTNIHFTKEFHRGDDGDDFRKPYLPTLYAMIGLAIFILLIAGINFINLSTAQSIQRSKEVGVRKVMGSGKGNIMFQFLVETFVLSLISITLSILLVSPLLRAFADYVPAGVSFHLLDISTMGFLLTVLAVTTIAAGFYPARVLASYFPVLNLRSTFLHQPGGKGRLRRALIIFQFTISLTFIIGAIVIGQQVRYMQSFDKGFNSDAIIVMNKWRDQGRKIGTLAEGLRKIPGVDQVIVQGTSPMGFAHAGETFSYRGDHEIKLDVSFDAASEDFIPFYRMKIIAGRNILHSDSMRELVINETCTKAMGFAKPEDAVGKVLYNTDRPYPVVGVVADFHEGSFHEAMKPVVIAKMPEREGSVAIKLSNSSERRDNAGAIIPSIEKEWKKIYPDDGFDYSFMNDAISRLYDQETKTAWLVNVGMALTIFISCMGLFGLAMFTAEKRTREIGIRKVLGASISDVVVMLTRDFVWLVLLASLIASPIAWFFMNQWLQDFVYRINFGWWIFALATFGAILIALVTVSSQAVRVAMMNPTTSLRTE